MQTWHFVLLETEIPSRPHRSLNIKPVTSVDGVFAQLKYMQTVRKLMLCNLKSLFNDEVLLNAVFNKHRSFKGLLDLLPHFTFVKPIVLVSSTPMTLPHTLANT